MNLRYCYDINMGNEGNRSSSLGIIDIRALAMGIMPR